MNPCEGNNVSYECKAYNKTPKSQSVNIPNFPCCSLSGLSGPGTAHPIGLTKDQMITITHQTQRLVVNITGYPDGGDIMAEFYAGGGFSGSIIGSIGGLAAISDNNIIYVRGETLPEGTEINERICGQQHKLISTGRISVDTSKVICKNRLYWPEIKIDILAGSGGPLTATSYRQGAQVRGGVMFEPYGALINMYSVPFMVGVIPKKLDTILGYVRLHDETTFGRVKGEWSLKENLNAYEEGHIPYEQLLSLPKYIVDKLNLQVN